MADLLDCLAELRRQTAARKQELEHLHVDGDGCVCDALSRLGALEGALREVGAEAASVHQQLRHLRLI